MPAYCFFDIREIKDAVAMEDYRARVNAVVESFGGRYLVIGGPFEVVEGSYHPVFPVMIEFPSMARMHGGGRLRRVSGTEGAPTGRDCFEFFFHERNDRKSLILQSVGMFTPRLTRHNRL